MWPFSDGILVGWAEDLYEAHRILRAHGQVWDGRLRRWVARVPRARFPIVDDVEYATTAQVVATMLAS